MKSNNQTQISAKILYFTPKECKFLMDVIRYQIKLAASLPNRKAMVPSYMHWLHAFQNGRNVLIPRFDTIYNVKASGEFLADIDEFRDYHVYNIHSWSNSQVRLYTALTRKFGRRKSHKHA